LFRIDMNCYVLIVKTCKIEVALGGKCDHYRRFAWIDKSCTWFNYIELQTLVAKHEALKGKLFIVWGQTIPWVVPLGTTPRNG
jgi:hypothetical protein